MNLREETIKVLRPFAALIDTIECTTEHKIGEDSNWDINAPAEYSIVSIGDLLAARRLYLSLSRIEAGSGEETDAVGWWNYSINYGPDGEENYANVYTPAGELVGNLRIHHAIAIVDGLKAAKADRPHVATPAPGENSERAEAERIAAALAGASKPGRAYYNQPWLAMEIEAALTASFAAGRRSMREEAAKVAEETDYHGKVPLGWTLALDTAANRIRAIPEKQS